MWRRCVADIHLWLSLIVGIQVLAWVVSGLFMAAQPIERVRSEHLLTAPTTVDLNASGSLISAALAMASAEGPVKSLTLEMLGSLPVYVLDQHNSDSVLVDAQSGERLSPISEALARAVAEDAIAGEESAMSATLIEHAPPTEYRGELPAWRVEFAGEDQLSVYVAADTGRVTARRSNLWRTYDFLWGLHIMDYRERSNFNHPLLISFSVGAVLMSIAGVVLLTLRLPARIRSRAPKTRATAP